MERWLHTLGNVASFLRILRAMKRTFLDDFGVAGVWALAAADR